jgi:rod shape-determining protein MreD
VSRNRQIFLFIVVVVAFVLQLSVMPQFKLFGVQPDLILVVAIVVAVQDGPVQGAVVGFLGGMLLDIASPQVMGVSALTKALAAFLAGMLKDFFMTYSILLPVLLVFILSFVELLLHQGVLVVLGQEQLPPLRAAALFAISLYNVLAVMVIYPLLRRFQFPEKEEAFSMTGGSRRA